MEIRKVNDFVEDINYDDYFATKCCDWYGDDACLILTPAELGELNLALNEWVENNNIVKVQTVAKINAVIGQYLKEEEKLNEN